MFTSGQSLKDIRLTFLPDPFLQTPITRETPDLVIDDLQIILVIRRRELFRSDGHSYGIGDPLT